MESEAKLMIHGCKILKQDGMVIISVPDGAPCELIANTFEGDFDQERVVEIKHDSETEGVRF